ncbi:MAG TPA: hypothetical protein VNZ55_02060 [Thermomicrobiales bacterium]|nr:hypothetical protein [Thermomicrobiales bacterium]
MELVSLHPFDPSVARSYVQAVLGERPVPPEWQAWWNPALLRALSGAREGNESAANQLTYGLGQALASEQPVFAHDGFGLTLWEARIDRGVGMLMRPPSRLFGEAGLDDVTARAMPIRLDLQQGMMGGAYIPARLVPDFERLLDTRLERTARRLHEGEYDVFAMLGLMLDAVAYARTHGFGLYEAMDIVGPSGEAPAGAAVVRADRKRIDPDVRARIELAIKPPKKPGLLSRLLGRTAPANVDSATNGHAASPHSTNGSAPSSADETR